MGMKPAEIDKNGLALPPSSIDCLGDSCHFSQNGGSCFSDRHHLYYYKDRYNAKGPKSLAHRLRQDPFNIIWIARCRHDQIHNTYNGPQIPGEDVMDEFLQEAGLLRELGVSAIRLASLELDLNFDRNFKPYKSKDHIGQRIPELIEFQRNRVMELGPLLSIMEVVPPVFISNPFRIAYMNAPPNVIQNAANYLETARRAAA